MWAGTISPFRTNPTSCSHCLFSHSEDLEDTDHRAGLARRCHLHGQRLHEDAGKLTRAARICAVFSPAYPHQGEPPAACTRVLTLLPTHTIKTQYRMKCFSQFLTYMLMSPPRNFPGAMETTLCSTTLIQTLYLKATRTPTTERMQPTWLHYAGIKSLCAA